MKIYILCYVVVMITLSIAYNIEDEDKKRFNRRRRQIRQMFRRNVLREAIENATRDRVDVSKKDKVDTWLSQAGLTMQYAEYIVISILSSIVMGFVFGILLDNILLGILFLFIGYLIPKQIIDFIRNKRIEKIDKQVGAFMYMVTKRYESTKDFTEALRLTEVEFRGQEPIHNEIERTILEIELGVPTAKALRSMSLRTGNRYMVRFADFYEITSKIGTSKLREELPLQAYEQYKENESLERVLHQEISGPKQDAYVMIIAVPLFALYQIFTNQDYIYIMTKTTIGKIGTTAVAAALLGVIWFINKKLGAPISE